MSWKVNTKEYLTPLNKYENVDVMENVFALNGHVYKDGRLKTHDRVTIVEYEKMLIVFTTDGKVIAELNKKDKFSIEEQLNTEMEEILMAKIAYTREEADSLLTCAYYVEGIMDEMNIDDHEVFCTLNEGVNAIYRIANTFINNTMLMDSMKCISQKRTHEHIEKNDMSPQEFGKFVQNWILEHLEDERLCIGYVERLFNIPIETYKRNLTQKKQ